MKHLTGQQHPFTTIVKEFPKACTRKDVPYYPIPKKANQELFERYHELASNYSSIILLGRLADYHAYDMHEAVKTALGKYNLLAGL